MTAIGRKQPSKHFAVECQLPAYISRSNQLMSESKITSLGSEYQGLFSIFDDAGFKLTVEMYSPESFGNFIVDCQRPDAKFRVTNDRSQVFIEVMTSEGQWLETERILESAGASMSRYETIDGLWTGYEPILTRPGRPRFASRTFESSGPPSKAR